MEMQEEVNQSVASDNCASYGMKLLSVPTQDVDDAFATQGYAPSAKGIPDTSVWHKAIEPKK